MRSPQEALDLIMRFERHREKWYDDGWGHETIGFGFTESTPGLDPDAIPVPLSEGAAVDLMVNTIATHYEPGVLDAIDDPGSLSDRQVGALVSLAWNVGVEAVQASQLVEEINAGMVTAAGDLFLDWVYVDGERVEGLVVRRESERRLYWSGIPPQGEMPDVPVAGVQTHPGEGPDVPKDLA